MLTGENINPIHLGDEFILSGNDGFTAFYPELKVFKDSLLTHVNVSSKTSVTGSLFVGDGSEFNPLFDYHNKDMGHYIAHIIEAR